VVRGRKEFSNGSQGVLRHNEDNDKQKPTSIETQYFGIANIVLSSAGSSRSAAVTEEDNLYTWGQA